MKIIEIFFIFIIFISCDKETFFSENYREKFYYAFDEKIPLTESINKAVISVEQFVEKKLIVDELKAIVPVLEETWRNDRILLIITSDKLDKERILNEAVKIEGVRTVQPVYLIDTGLEMGVGDEIAVKFKENVSQKQINSIIKKYDLEVIRANALFSIIRVSKGKDALQIANRIQESGLAVFSHPDFIVNMVNHR
jgi:hypothetical protein